jgi:hypothetical protein
LSGLPRLAAGAAVVVAGCSGGGEAAAPQPPGCDARPRQLDADRPHGATTLRLPGRPFDVVTDRSGGWAFASLPSTAGRPRLAVLRRAGAHLRLVRTVRLARDLQPFGLHRSGGRLLVAAGAALIALDIADLRRGAGVPIRRLARGRGLIGVTATRDGRAVFATDESRSELVAVRAGRVTRVPLAKAPVGVALSADERHAFVASEFDADWRDAGVLSVVHAQRALDGDAGDAVVATVPAGCHPVRVLHDAARDLVWVSARESHAVLAYDVAAPSAPRLAAVVRVGRSPVDLALAGRSLVVANSHRFGTGGSLSVIDVVAALAGRAGSVTGLDVARFPRALALLPGAARLLVASHGSRSIEMLPIAALR